MFPITLRNHSAAICPPDLGGTASKPAQSVHKTSGPSTVIENYASDALGQKAGLTQACLVAVLALLALPRIIALWLLTVVGLKNRGTLADEQQPISLRPEKPLEPVPPSLRRRVALVRPKGRSAMVRPHPQRPQHRKRPKLAAHDEPLRPNEVLGKPVLLGRDASVRVAQGSHRSNYALYAKLGAVLRTAEGKCNLRLLAHAFSLPGEGLEGTYLVESLRDISETLLLFLAGARDLPMRALAQLEPLLEPLVEAMHWASQISDRSMSGPDIVDGMLASLRLHGRVIIPAVVGGFELNPSNEGGDPQRSAHAMLIELRSTGDGWCDLRLYNRGAGIGKSHTSAMGHDGKLRYAAAFEVQGIAIAGDALRAALLKLLGLKKAYQTPFDENIDTCYRAFAKLGVATLSEGPFCKPQTVGNCAWKSVTSLIKDNCDEATYRAYKVYLRSRLLEEAAWDVPPVNGERKIVPHHEPDAPRAAILAGMTASAPVAAFLSHLQDRVFEDVVKLRDALFAAKDFEQSADVSAQLMAATRAPGSEDSSRRYFDVCAYVRLEREEVGHLARAFADSSPV